MKLRRHLNQTAQTPEQFGNRIGVSAVSVRRYMSGERIPERDVMAEIVKATGGAVQPNDFYGVDEPQPEPDPEEAEAA